MMIFTSGRCTERQRFRLVDDRRNLSRVRRRMDAAIAARRTEWMRGRHPDRRSDKADFRMRFFNPDGTEVEMCATARGA